MSDGTGSVYKRGQVWWIDYSFRGERHRESSGSKKKKVAVALLRQRMEEMGNGGPKVDEEEVTFEDLGEIITDDYKVNGKKSIGRMEAALDHLRKSFAGWRTVDISTDRIKAHIRMRQEEGAANGTIRRELATIKRAFNLAVQAGLLSRTPHVPSIEVDNTRENFLTMGDVDAICEEISEDLAPVVRFAALTGWRKGEIIAFKDNPGLRWHQVDFEAGVVRLEPGTTKNKEGRSFPFAALPPLEKLMRRQRERTDGVERERGEIVPHVFHRDGEPIRTMYKAWVNACKRAGLGKPWFHDLRRTAVRNMERAGVSRSVAMKLSGHKTEAIYRRYAIADEDALREGVEKLANLHEGGGDEEGRTVVPLEKRREA